MLEFEYQQLLEPELLQKGITYAYDVLGSTASHKEGRVCWDEQLGPVFQDKYLQVKAEKGLSLAKQSAMLLFSEGAL